MWFFRTTLRLLRGSIGTSEVVALAEEVMYHWLVVVVVLLICTSGVKGRKQKEKDGGFEFLVMARTEDVPFCFFPFWILITVFRLLDRD